MKKTAMRRCKNRGFNEQAERRDIIIKNIGIMDMNNVKAGKIGRLYQRQEKTPKTYKRDGRATSTLTMLTIMTPRHRTQNRLAMRSDLIRRVLSNYDEPFASAEFKHHPSSGLSGADLWRCDIAGRLYVLRRWPDGQMTAARLEW